MTLTIETTDIAIAFIDGCWVIRVLNDTEAETVVRAYMSGVRGPRPFGGIREIQAWASEPPLFECSKCGRKAWNKMDYMELCRMPQPIGPACMGIFYPIEK